MQTEKTINIYLISFITFSGIFLFGLGIIGSERLIPILEKSFKLEHWKSGTIISSAVIGFLIAMLVGGTVSDFISRKHLIITGFSLLIFGTILFGYSSSYLFLLLGNLFIGISGGLLEGLLSLVIMDIFKHKRGMALNLSQVFFGLGAGSSPFLVMIFRKWEVFYLIIAIASLITLLISLPQKFPDKEDILENSSEKEVKILHILTDKKFLLTILAMILYSCTEIGIASWISVLFARYYQSSRLMATLSLSSYWTGQLIGRSTIGLKVDKIKNENFISLLFFITTVFIFFGLAFKCSLTTYIFFTLSGLSMGPLWPTILSKARNRFNSFPGTAFGVIVSSGAAASILIPPLIGRLGDLYSIRMALFLTVITSLFGAIIYMNLVKTAKVKNEYR